MTEMGVHRVGREKEKGSLRRCALDTQKLKDMEQSLNSISSPVWSDLGDTAQGQRKARRRAPQSYSIRDCQGLSYWGTETADPGLCSDLKGNQAGCL